MKFHYGGKYTDESQLIRKPDPENSVMFKEPESMNKMAIKMNILALIVFFFFMVLLFVRGTAYKMTFLGTVLFFLSMVPHEFLHAICFKEDVTMYTNLSKFMLFVYGTEDMSKTRFILMSLCPNIVFGLIPFVIFMIFPTLNTLGTLGAMALSAGAGDYLNVIHALTEVPNGAKVYCNGIHTYWYKQD
ncbi:MAG: DUF3267 domain-containing protein [Ruminococcus sp.]|nr:DUF3267 domain-containing protein [Ruminococcus sp.]